MEPLMRNVLTAAGVDIPQETPVVNVWRDWLNVESCLSLEQMAPLNAAVYEAFVHLLVFCWQTTVHLDQESSSIDLSLKDQVESVQATEWLRHVMDLHVDNEATFSQCLLQSQQLHELLEALFHHIASLPYIPQQIHYRAQALRQQTQHLSSNVVSRLEHYQQTQTMTERLLQELDQHVLKLEEILGEWYSLGSPQIRVACRRHLGRVWHDFTKKSHYGGSGGKMENTSATGMSMTLRVLYRILQGSTSQPTPAHHHLLVHQLLPLHQPNAMVLWRDQTCLLELYHEPLVQCMSVILQKQPNYIPTTIEALLQPNIWPTAGGNTPKIVLLIHEVDMLLQLDADAQVWESHKHLFLSLLLKLSLCMSSDNSRMAEQALQMFRNEVFVKLVEYWYDDSMDVLLKALVKRELPWNPTVRKMTYNVLSQLREYSEEKFAVVANRVFDEQDVTMTMSSTPATEERRDTSTADVTMETTPTLTETSKPQAPLPPDRFSLKAGMGDWRPPSASSSRGHHHYAMLPPKSRPPRSSANEAPPPLTITGVAPWAMSSSSTTHKRTAEKAQLPDINKMSHPAPILEEEEEEDETGPGLKRVLDYMNELKPPSTEKDDSGTSSWARAQMAETPTLLPSLKFHDLVFGHDLGKGAFGLVRYARHIDKSTTRSHWAEYAVKIISTERIQEMGYEASVQREITILRILSHPCIARLISSFRFGDGAYLVLEYASGGDLHGLLKTQGSLDEQSTKFVVGQVASALASIHDLGFVYGDLKPENVLITETGHIKLTDFGACRPVTEAAKERIRPSGKHLLKELRDGDWKERPKEVDVDEDEEMRDAEQPEEDHRIEGTTAYLPPEVVLGAVPTPAADAWALGCVMYQCLSGRPPLLDMDDHTTKHKIVTFHMEDGLGGSEEDDALFRDSHSRDIAPEARQLIRRLLARDSRPTMAQVAEDPFFTGTDIFALHRQSAVPLGVGTVAPVQDAQWARRQYSSIWAPQPKAYDISLPDSIEFATNPQLMSKAPIPEGEEANAFFSWSRHGSQ